MSPLSRPLLALLCVYLVVQQSASSDDVTELTGLKGEFDSPSTVSNTIPADTEKNWRITVTEGYVMEIHIVTGDTTNGDILDIYDGYNETATKLVRKDPDGGAEVHKSTGNVVYFELMTGSSQTHPTFEIQWIMDPCHINPCEEGQKCVNNDGEHLCENEGGSTDGNTDDGSRGVMLAIPSGLLTLMLLLSSVLRA